MKKSKQQQNLAEELQKSFDRWDELYQNGGSDPFNSDGSNLYLVRNHIIYWKDKITEQYVQKDYPPIYDRETPPEISFDYMARSDEIRANAKCSLILYKQDDNLLFLRTKIHTMEKIDIKGTCINYVIGYADSLEDAIKNDDLVSMRRHGKPDTYLDAFAQCAEKVREIKPPDNEQISLFSFMQDSDYDEDEYDIDEDDNQCMDMKL